jgi:phospholipid transport system substrate-binding protein
VTLATIGIALSGQLSRSEAGEPTDQIRTHIAKMYESLRSSPSAGSPTRIPALQTAADEMFDWGAMSKDSLGEHWAKRSAEERSEFARLFVSLFEDAYLSKIRLAEADKFQYLGDTVHEDDAVVRTNVVTKNGSVISVIYRARRDDAGRWRVYDLDVERVSLIRNYRAQFDSIIRRTSFEQLIARMKVAEDKRTSSLGARTRALAQAVEAAPAARQAPDPSPS